MPAASSTRSADRSTPATGSSSTTAYPVSGRRLSRRVSRADRAGGFASATAIDGSMRAESEWLPYFAKFGRDEIVAQQQQHGASASAIDYDHWQSEAGAARSRQGARRRRAPARARAHLRARRRALLSRDCSSATTKTACCCAATAARRISAWTSPITTKSCSNSDRVVDILGPDHHGYIERLKGLASALGYPGRLEVLIAQQVTLMRGSEQVSMSKRAGEIVTLDEILDEVGVDAARFFFIMLAVESPLTFDLKLAVEKDTENPVYYVQYGHARIASVLRRALPRSCAGGAHRVARAADAPVRARACAPARRVSQRRRRRRANTSRRIAWRATRATSPPTSTSSTPSARSSPTIARRGWRGWRSASPPRTFWRARSRSPASARRTRCKLGVSGVLPRFGCSAYLPPPARCARARATSSPTGCATRSILGVAIPLVLGSSTLLYPIACWCALAMLRRNRLRRRAACARADRANLSGAAALSLDRGARRGRVAAAGAAAARRRLALVSPSQRRRVGTGALALDDGNALLVVSAGVGALRRRALRRRQARSRCRGADFGALALLGFRIVAWARDALRRPAASRRRAGRRGGHRFPLAIQAGTLQNDVWLAAFLARNALDVANAGDGGSGDARVRTLPHCSNRRAGSLRSLALVARRAPASVWLGRRRRHSQCGSFATRCSGGVRASRRRARVRRCSAARRFSRTAAPALALAGTRRGCGVTVCAGGALRGACSGPRRAPRIGALGWAACASALLFFVLPFGYNLQSAARDRRVVALRRARDCARRGAARPSSRAHPGNRRRRCSSHRRSSASGTMLAIFWNDGSTHAALPSPSLAVAVAGIALRSASRGSSRLRFGSAMIVATHLAARTRSTITTTRCASAPIRPASTLDRGDAPAGGRRLGSAPRRRQRAFALDATIDLSDGRPCAQARRNRVLCSLQ